MESKKIAFIKIGSDSFVNENLLKVFEKVFPDFEIQVIDAYRDLINNREVINGYLAVIKEYGLNLLLGKTYRGFLLRRNTGVKKLLIGTTYFFKTVKTAIARHLESGDYIFSFQTQSLFDASMPGLTHFVYTDHTMLANLYYPNFDKRKMLSEAWAALEKTIYQNAAINFTKSNHVARSLIEQYSCPPDKVVCAYAGSNVKAKNIITDDKNYENRHILFIGIDWQRKGGPQLIEAFKSVLNVYPDARLTIVGCSPKLSIPNCRVVGRVSLDAVAKFYEQASIFCVPTILEPFGIVFIEALMHKLPVVATNIGALPDFIHNEENGYLVEPYDIEKLAEVLIHLLGDPQKCKTFGEKGHDIVSERYDWENVAALMKQYIMSTLNNRLNNRHLKRS